MSEREDDLLSRLAAATEGSAELDREVLLACGWTDRGEGRIAFRWVDPAGVLHSLDVMPTRSLDDITRMIEEAGMEWRANSGGVAEVESMTVLMEPVVAYHASPCIALVLAFLRAREAGR